MYNMHILVGIVFLFVLEQTKDKMLSTEKKNGIFQIPNKNYMLHNYTNNESRERENKNTHTKNTIGL